MLPTLASKHRSFSSVRLPWRLSRPVLSHFNLPQGNFSFQSFRFRPLTTTASSHSGSKQDLFSYTTGRYLYNEHIRLAERYIEFNIGALEAVAVRSVDRKKVVHTSKLAEGGFNRIFLLTMDDGFEVIAKIPFPLTVPKKLTTESEVATLDLLRRKGIPVPRVYAYSSTDDNPVGSEYILMEKAPGKPLTSRWFELTPRERVSLVVSFVEIEKKLFDIPFGSYGSLYYKDNLPSSRSDLYASPNDTNEKFCIGPSADHMFWRGRHGELDLNRGPWKEHSDYVRSIGEREIEWTARFGKPLEVEFPHNMVIKEELSPDTYLDLLRKFVSLSPYILPKDRASPMNEPTLRHPDMNPSNIFVTDSCEISCIIDWQHSSIQPLLLTAGNPPMFENPDPEPPAGLQKPSLPENYESLSPKDKEQAEELFRRRGLFYLYMVFNSKDNVAHFKALYYPLLAMRQHAVDRAGRKWTGNIITLKGAILRLVEYWDQLVDSSQAKTTCPVTFSPEEIEEFLQTEEYWFKATSLVEHWRSLLDDLGQDGWVRHESYEQAVETNRKLRDHWFAETESEEDVAAIKRWPFQDHEEID